MLVNVSPLENRALISGISHSRKMAALRWLPLLNRSGCRTEAFKAPRQDLPAAIISAALSARVPALR